MRIFKKIFLVTTFLSVTFSAFSQKAIVTVNEFEGKDVISRDIYGHFSEHLGHCIYGGLYVGEGSSIPNVNGVRKDILDAMKQIKVPNLRWPGGCFADEYHWKDGIGPKEKRPSMVNTHWGGVTEDNSFGTHEFLDMCEYAGIEPYISVNVGSSTEQEIAQWVEYMTFDGKSPMADLRRQNGRDKPWKIKYIGIGNETWGCGGHMTAEYYSDICRRYSVYMRNFSGNKLYKIGAGAYDINFNWTEVLMKNASSAFDGLSLHFYTAQGDRLATDFDDNRYYCFLALGYKMEEYITKHSTIMDKYDPAKRVGLMVDEWGAWYKVEEGTNPGFLYQQNTLSDAILAAMTLNILNNHCDRVRMSNIAQFVNVLQALFLTKDEKMIKTPTFFVYDMYKVHQDATMLPTSVDTKMLESNKLPEIVVSSSKDSEGNINISFVNVSLTENVDIDCILVSDKMRKFNGGNILTSNDVHDHNTFENPDIIALQEFKECSLKDNHLTFTIPAKSIVTVSVK